MVAVTEVVDMVAVTEGHMKCHMVEVMEVILSTEGSQDTEVMLNMAVTVMAVMAMASSSMESTATMASSSMESTESMATIEHVTIALELVF